MPNNWLIYRTKISLKKRHQSHQIYYAVNIFIHQWKIWFQFYHKVEKQWWWCNYMQEWTVVSN